MYFIVLLMEHMKTQSQRHPWPCQINQARRAVVHGGSGVGARAGLSVWCMALRCGARYRNHSMRARHGMGRGRGGSVMCTRHGLSMPASAACVDRRPGLQ